MLMEGDLLALGVIEYFDDWVLRPLHNTYGALEAAYVPA